MQEVTCLSTVLACDLDYYSTLIGCGQLQCGVLPSALPQSGRISTRRCVGTVGTFPNLKNGLEDGFLDVLSTRAIDGAIAT